MISGRESIVGELPKLRRYARALLRDPADADDLVQDCLERALRQWGQLKQGTKLRPWLFSILHNLYIDGGRKLGRKIDDIPLTDEHENSAGSEPVQDHRLAVRDLIRALGGLSDDQRAVVLLIGLEGMSYKDSADILSIPVGTVMSRLARGRAQLSQLMETGARPQLRIMK